MNEILKKRGGKEIEGAAEILAELFIIQIDEKYTKNKSKKSKFRKNEPKKT